MISNKQHPTVTQDDLIMRGLWFPLWDCWCPGELINKCDFFLCVRGFHVCLAQFFHIISTEPNHLLCLTLHLEMHDQYCGLHLLCCIGRLRHVVLLLALQLGIHGVDWIFVHQFGIQRQGFHHLQVQVWQLRVLSDNTNTHTHTKNIEISSFWLFNILLVQRI